MHVALDRRSKTLGPLSGLHHGLGRQRCKLLQRQNSQAETKNNSTRKKSTPWPGATPFCPRFSGPKRPRGFGSLPARMHALISRVRCFAAHEDARSGFKPSAGIAPLHTTDTDSFGTPAISLSRSAIPRALVRPDVPRLGHQRSLPNRGQRLRQPQSPSDKEWPSRPIFCQTRTHDRPRFYQPNLARKWNSAWKRSFHP